MTIEKVLRQLLPKLLDEQREDLIARFTEAILEEREACIRAIEWVSDVETPEACDEALEHRANTIIAFIRARP